MIGVLVGFHYEANFDEQRVRRVADGARENFVGLPGLRAKVFTVDADKREALNFYLWESEDAARAFFTPALVERVTMLYGVRPSIQFLNVVAFVDNSPTAGHLRQS